MPTDNSPPAPDGATITLRHAPGPDDDLDARVDQVVTNIDADLNPAQLAAVRGVVSGLMVIEIMRAQMRDDAVDFEAFVGIVASEAAARVVELLVGEGQP